MMKQILFKLFASVILVSCTSQKESFTISKNEYESLSSSDELEVKNQFSNK